MRTHLALGKDAPPGSAVQRSGVIVAIPILSGLHHHYVRILFSERTGHAQQGARSHRSMMGWLSAVGMSRHCSQDEINVLRWVPRSAR
jgi:hypothetical protein